MKEVYLDNAAATKPDERVVRAMARAARSYGNPSSFNDAGRAARDVVDDARDRVAKFLNARATEIIFCASGSEANSLALAGAGVLTQATEHPSVLRAAGNHARILPVDTSGIVDPEAVRKAIRKDTTIVSVMYANNETGTIQPIKKIARIIRDYRREHRSRYPLLHVDACQATPWLPMDVQELGVDLLTFNGTKVHGPHGTAVLFVRRGADVRPLILGGKQEFGLRAGTEDVAGIVGLATALSRIQKKDEQRVRKLRQVLLKRLPAIIPDVRINGASDAESLPNIVNISIPNVSSEELLLALDRRGIRAGAGSACTAHRVEPSHVLVAMRVPRRYLTGVLRISMSKHTTRTEVEILLRELPKAIVSC